MGMTKNNVPGNEGMCHMAQWCGFKSRRQLFVTGEKSYKKCLFHRVLDSK